MNKVISSFYTNTSTEFVQFPPDCLTKDSEIESLTKALENNVSTRVLTLSNNSLWPSAGIFLGKMLLTNSFLEVLNLSHNVLGDTGVIEIAEGLRRNNTLRELDLNNNEISDVGAVALLKALKNNSSLRVLKINWNCISTPILGDIQRALQRVPPTNTNGTQKLQEKLQLLSVGHRELASQLQKERERANQSKAAQKRALKALQQDLRSIQLERDNLLVENQRLTAQLVALASVNDLYQQANARVEQLQSTLKATVQNLNEVERNSPSLNITKHQTPSSHHDEDEKLCKVCQENPVEIVIIPCGHLILCGECVSGITTCPYCRIPITQTCKVYV